VEQLVFGHTIDGLVRSIGKRMTPELEQRLRECGLPPDGVRKAGYRYAEWKALVRAAREHLFPELPEEPGYRRLGLRFIEAYFEGAMGRTVAALSRLLGPKRMLARATQNFRSGNNFTECRLTEIRPSLFELWINAVEHPGFTAGILEGALRAAGAKDIDVRITGNDVEAWSFRIAWT
jgi:uncharacterized protein (TIGR02265 family)